MSHAFTATIEKDGAYPTFVTVPDSKTVFGTGRPVKVVGTVDGELLEATLMPSGEGGHWLPLRQAVCDATGKSDAGQPVDVVLRPRETKPLTAGRRVGLRGRSTAPRSSEPSRPERRA